MSVEIQIAIAVPDGDGGEVRYEVGDTVTWADLAHADIEWLYRKGAIDKPPPKKKKRSK